MGNYLIGIGGTGAKCVESFIHLCAAGFLEASSKCKIFFVDLDSSNGSLGRALTTLQSYLNCSKINIGGSHAFSADLSPYEQRVWNPLPEAESRSLRSFYSYDDPHERNQKSARLMDALFAPEHIDLRLNEGFRAVTSVGAAIMAGTVDLNEEEPWNELFEDLRRDASNAGGANVMLVGSVFGGTGASGIPTIGRLIANHLQSAVIHNVRIGATLMLPYFSFGNVDDEQVQADASKFLPATQTALNYYDERAYLDVFAGGVYLIGEQSVANVSIPSVGGRDQENDPHPIEIFAALAAVDFFNKPDDERRCMVAARDKSELIQWTDLPAPSHLNARSKLGQFLRFSYAYIAACHPSLMEYVRSRAAHKTPWITTFFKSGPVNFQELGKYDEHVRAYCEAFLVWFGAMHLHSRSGHLQLGLALPDLFVETAGDPPRIVLKQHLRPNEFEHLLLPARSKEGRSFQQLWDALADSRPSNPSADQGFAQLVTNLYELSAIN